MNLHTQIFIGKHARRAVQLQVQRLTRLATRSAWSGSCFCGRQRPWSAR